MDLSSKRNLLIFAVVALLITPIVLLFNQGHHRNQKTIHPFPDMTVVLEENGGNWLVISHEYPNSMDQRAKKYIEAIPVDDKVPSSYDYRVSEYAHNNMYDEAIACKTKMIKVMESAPNRQSFANDLVKAKKHLAELKLIKRAKEK